MNRPAVRLTATLLVASGLVLATAVLLLVEPAAGPTAAHGLSRPDQATPPPAGVPCGPVISRTISPGVVEAGGLADVRVTYDYTCAAAAQQVDLVIVIGRGLPGSSTQRLLLTRNFRDGMGRFVNMFSVPNGSRVGLIDYGHNATILMPLQSGPGAVEELLQKVGQTVSMTTDLGANGLALAILQADRMLADASSGPDVAKAILVTYLDAPLAPPPAPTPSAAIPAACAQARGNGATLAAIGLDHATLLQSCTSPGGHFRSTAGVGADLPGLFEQAGTIIFRPKQASAHDYTDQLFRSRADYVAGSGQPREPDERAGSSLIWIGRAVAKPAGGESIAYRVRLSADGAPWRGPISIDASLALLYGDGSVATVPAPNPDICVYRPGRPEDCADVWLTAVPTRSRAYVPSVVKAAP